LAEAFADDILIPLSILPGRIRWRVAGLRSDVAGAALFETLLAASDWIQSAVVNVATGRVLVHFDPELPPEIITGAVRDAAQSSIVPDEDELLEERESDRYRQIVESAGAAAAGAAVGLLFSVGTATAIGIGVVSGAGWYFGKRLHHRITAEIGLAKQDSAVLVDGIRKHRTPFAKAMGIDFVAGLFGAARMAMLGGAINAVMSGWTLKIPGLALGATGTAVLLCAGALVSIALRGWYKNVSRVIWSGAAREFQHELRMTLYHTTQQMEVDYFESRSTGDILSGLTQDLANVEQGFDAAWYLFDAVIYCSIMLAGVFYIASRLAWVTLLPMPVIVGLSLAFYPRMREWSQKVRDAATRLSDEMRQSLDGVTTIKSFTAEEHQEQRVALVSDIYKQQSQRALEATGYLPILLEGTVFAAQTIMYVVSGRLGGGGTTMSLGTFVNLNQLSSHSFVQLIGIGPHVDNLERGLAAMTRIREKLRMKPPVDALAPVVPLQPDVAGEIVYRDVVFSYPKSPAPVFRGLSLRIAPRRITGIVGLTGAGKSTLIKLLLRFYEPQEGAIELDGVDIRRIPRHELRDEVSIVSQDIFLFNRTVLENISLGRPAATATDILNAARLAQADEFIGRLPQSYETILGNEGVALSGGERQRIAIARGLLKDAQVMIFDEATAQLDSNTEVDFRNAMQPLLEGRTTIVIAHRLAMVKNADVIYVLERGRVVEQGTHDELLDHNGRYRSLWLTQLGESAHQQPAPGDLGNPS
jgi:ATP-binding cassette, subfamily B, bacterial